MALAAIYLLGRDEEDTPLALREGPRVPQYYTERRHSISVSLSHSRVSHPVEPQTLLPSHAEGWAAGNCCTTIIKKVGAKKTV